ncbi:Hypothetical predicted protein, partial [Xyrichtys novacula]
FVLYQSALPGWRAEKTEILLTCSLHPPLSPPCVPAALDCTASWVLLRPCQNPIWIVSSASLE